MKKYYGKQKSFGFGKNIIDYLDIYLNITNKSFDKRVIGYSESIIKSNDGNFYHEAGNNSYNYILRINYPTYTQYKPIIYEYELKEIYNKSNIEKTIISFGGIDIGIIIDNLEKPTDFQYHPIPNGVFIIIKFNNNIIFHGEVDILKSNKWKKELLDFITTNNLFN